MAELSAPRRSDYKEEKEKEKDVRTSNIVAAKGIVCTTFSNSSMMLTFVQLWQTVFVQVLVPRYV
jgi:hypothetical protein